VLWVGHADLTASMGITGQYDHPDYKRALDRVVKAGKKHGSARPAVTDIDGGIAEAGEGWDTLCYHGDACRWSRSARASTASVPAPQRPGARRKGREGQEMTALLRVALSGDLRKPDGSPTYPISTEPLRTAPGVEMVFPSRPVRSAEQPEDFDASSSRPPLRRGERAEERAVGGRRPLASATTRSMSRPARVPGSRGHTPDGIRRPVAVSIITFMLALTGKLMVKDQLTRASAEGWAKRSDHMGVGLVGRTLGSLGIGNIGAEAYRLAKPFDMNFIAHDPYADKAVAAAWHRATIENCSVARHPVGELPADARHAPHRQRRAARADEADGVPHQHVARPGGRPEGTTRVRRNGARRGRPRRAEEEPPAPDDPIPRSTTSARAARPCWTDHASPATARRTCGR
jgi:D-3-phosphoglycerate dehydrogenase